MEQGLNPCCSGQWPRTVLNSHLRTQMIVLILVVVDNGLVRGGNLAIRQVAMGVLILVVVDNGLVLDLIRLY